MKVKLGLFSFYEYNLSLIPLDNNTKDINLDIKPNYLWILVKNTILFKKQIKSPCMRINGDYFCSLIPIFKVLLEPNPHWFIELNLQFDIIPHILKTVLIQSSCQNVFPSIQKVMKGHSHQDELVLLLF